VKRAASPGERPSSKQYAHPDIVAVLRAMSRNKCFYCEQRLGEGDQEVDHHVELHEDPSGAFLWANLYLSCPGCNKEKKKKLARDLPYLDPCAPAARPEEHLTFEDEIIRARNDSAAGHATIQKYGLHRAELELKRSKQLRLLDQALRRVYERMIADGRREKTEAERELLRRFAQRDHPFSLMFSVHLATHGV
jgi:hypothetical protein